MGTYKSFSITVQGISHIKQGKVCQDSSYRYEDASMCITAVADGHGDDNCFRSETGASYAISCAVSGIIEFVNINNPLFSNNPSINNLNSHLPDNWKKAIQQLIKHIIASWQIKIEEDFKCHRFSPQELSLVDDKHRKNYELGINIHKAYGSTLIVCVITPHYWLGIHIGDGRFTVLNQDGNFSQPVPWDDKCYLNVTTSICDDDAFERARFHFSLNAEIPPPIAVFLCTDGLDDNYPVDENEKHLFRLYRTIALTFAEDGFEATRNQLADLINSFATKGKGDDTSIAGCIDMDSLEQIMSVLQTAMSKEEKNQKKNNLSEGKKENHETMQRNDTVSINGDGMTHTINSAGILKNQNNFIF